MYIAKESWAPVKVELMQGKQTNNKKNRVLPYNKMTVWLQCTFNDKCQLDLAHPIHGVICLSVC